MCCLCVGVLYLCLTYLQDGVLEFIEVDWFEALELRMSTTQVIE